MGHALAVHNLERYGNDHATQGAIMTKTTEELGQRMHDDLRAFITKRVNDQRHTDDILQVVFRRVHRQIATVNDLQWLVSWIY